MACINGLCKNIRDTLLFDLAVFITREIRKALKIAFDLSLRLKMTNGISFKGFADDGGKAFIMDKNAPAPFDRLIFIPNRRIVNPIAKAVLQIFDLCDILHSVS